MILPKPKTGIKEMIKQTTAVGEKNVKMSTDKLVKSSNLFPNLVDNQNPEFLEFLNTKEAFFKEVVPGIKRFAQAAGNKVQDVKYAFKPTYANPNGRFVGAGVGAITGYSQTGSGDPSTSFVSRLGGAGIGSVAGSVFGKSFARNVNLNQAIKAGETLNHEYAAARSTADFYDKLKGAAGRSEHVAKQTVEQHTNWLNPTGNNIFEKGVDGVKKFFNSAQAHSFRAANPKATGEDLVKHLKLQDSHAQSLSKFVTDEHRFNVTGRNLVNNHEALNNLGIKSDTVATELHKKYGREGVQQVFNRPDGLNHPAVRAIMKQQGR
jgi:hypothetical protein